MAQKDFWDKFSIISGFIGSVVLVTVPIVIGLGAERISRSLERGQLVQSLIEDLTDDSRAARRDIALTALDAAVPPRQACSLWGTFGCTIDEQAPDLVADVAVILLRETYGRIGEADLDLARAEGETRRAVWLIRRRLPTTGEPLLADLRAEFFDPMRREADPVSESSDDALDRARKSQTAKVVSYLLPPEKPQEQQPQEQQPLAGVRLVYIQYSENRELAQRIQNLLRERGITVPGIERRTTSINDIRYPNTANAEIAKSLQQVVEAETGIRFDKLIDLSRSGYRVPDGQFEIWLKE